MPGSDNRMNLVPVGLVHCSARTRKEMPPEGMAGTIEVFPPYRPALEGIEEHTHLILLGWLHLASRDLLKAVPRKISAELAEKGVFALRSPSRPNPISVSVVRLIRCRENGLLEVDNLDLVDGTPVVDIKPYQAGGDCIFSATQHDRSEKIAKMDPGAYRADLIREAVNYHGEWCPGAAVAVRLAIEATRFMGGDLRRTEVVLSPGGDPCIADALIGITGARFGSHRLDIAVPVGTDPESPILFSAPGIQLRCLVRVHGRDPAEVLSMKAYDLFCLQFTREKENKN